MKYFTIGPVQMSERVMRAGGCQAEYFRDSAFADRVVVAQADLLSLLTAPPGSKLAVLSGSGTAAMEAALTGFTDAGECVVAINGGSFGSRFVDMARFFERDVVEFTPGMGKDIDLDALEDIIMKHQPRAILVNWHETSTGQLYDIAGIAKLARQVDALVICDAVSAILSDPFDMTRSGVDVAVFSANKGLALAPGAAFVAATPRALERLSAGESYYLNLIPYFEGAARGQPPYTSSIAVLMQLFERLEEIKDLGGISAVTTAVAQRAQFFRDEMLKIGIEQYPQTPSNAITSFVVNEGVSNKLYEYLHEHHQIMINKTAWGLGMDVPRVAHVGELSIEDHLKLTLAIKGFMKCI